MTRTMTILAFTAALALSACGKKGPLEPPPNDDDERTSLSLALIS